MAISLFKPKWVGYSVVASVLIGTTFLFQNCAQTKPIPGEQISSNAVSATLETPAQKIELKDEKINQVDLLVEGSRVINQNGRQFSIKEQQTLKIDLVSGQLQLASQPEAVHCLTDDLKNELATILNSASVCKREVASSQSTVCTMDVKSAYAEIHSERETFKLGLYSENCFGEYVDLCDEQSQMLKGFAKAVKANLSQLTCK